MIKRIVNFLQRENLHRLFLALASLVLIGTIGIALFEPEITWKNALWYSFVTITTVGYGDFSPQTTAGRTVGVIIMVFGIGLLGLFTATIASIFVEKKLKEERGMTSFDYDNHIILCEWNDRARDIIHELRMDRRIDSTPIILIADIENKPIDAEQFYFIQGPVTEENLQRANLKSANTVVILGDDGVDANARDAKAVLVTLTVESINPSAYTIVELSSESNVQYCERAHADEIIVGSEFSTKLISRAAIDHGISKVLSELLSSRRGNDLLKVPLPDNLAGKTFIDVFTEMKRSEQSIVLAVQKGGHGPVISNPAVDMVLEATDHLIVIKNREPAG